jgi:hypothetical protein
MHAFWGYQGPLVSTDITGRGLAFHTASVAASSRKCITRSRVNEGNSRMQQRIRSITTLTQKLTYLDPSVSLSGTLFFSLSRVAIASSRHAILISLVRDVDAIGSCYFIIVSNA